MERQSERTAMLDEQLRRRGIRDERVLEAMAQVPRHRFVLGDHEAIAYSDQALPIGAGQTISQPYIVALMAEALQLKGHERLLEIGTGSGYAAAVFAHLVAEVYTVERHADLARSAEQVFKRLGHTTIHVLVGDGTRGWPEHAPFEAISVAAGAPQVPPSLLQQLDEGGRLVMPVGQYDEQRLVRITRNDSKWTEESLGPVRFVPLIGEEGWSSGGQDMG